MGQHASRKMNTSLNYFLCANRIWEKLEDLVSPSRLQLCPAEDMQLSSGRSQWQTGLLNKGQGVMWQKGITTSTKQGLSRIISNTCRLGRKCLQGTTVEKSQIRQICFCFQARKGPQLDVNILVTDLHYPLARVNTSDTAMHCNDVHKLLFIHLYFQLLCYCDKFL